MISFRLRSRLSHSILLCILLTNPSAWAQAPSSSAAPSELEANQSEIEQREPNFIRTGKDIPLYVVVREFFSFALRCYKGPNWRGFLEKLEIAPGSESETLFKRAMFDSFEIHAEGIDLRPFVDDPEMYTAVQLEFTRKKVLALREVFLNMCDRLEAEGTSPSAMYQFMQQKVRPSISLYSHPGPDLELFEVWAEFEQR